MNGVLVIDKPAGPTSHDIVSSLRKILRTKKVGHTGTLDPAATGVLPIVLGRATKISRYLTHDKKRYTATVKLGENTDTLDGEGAILRSRPVTCSEEDVRAAIKEFVGEIAQVPPMYSAKKVNGEKLYDLARKGVEIEREAKNITIESIELLSCDLPSFVIDVRCSAGTYLRVLAEDIGEKLGCGAYLSGLRRTEAGTFTLENALTMDALLESDDAIALAQEHLLPMHQALGGLPVIKLPRHTAKMVVSGHQLQVSDLLNVDIPVFAKDDAVALMSAEGTLVAVARGLFGSSELEDTRRERHALKTERVLAQHLG